MIYTGDGGETLNTYSAPIASATNGKYEVAARVRHLAACLWTCTHTQHLHDARQWRTEQKEPGWQCHCGKKGSSGRLRTLTTGARQLVVQEAAVMMWSLAGSYWCCTATRSHA